MLKVSSQQARVTSAFVCPLNPHAAFGWGLALSPPSDSGSGEQSFRPRSDGLPAFACLSIQYFGNPRSITSRCDLKANLIRNGCGGEMESPASSTHVLRSLPLSSKGSSATGSDVIQMTPQEVAVSLRPGESSWGCVVCSGAQKSPVGGMC